MPRGEYECRSASISYTSRENCAPKDRNITTNRRLRDGSTSTARHVDRPASSGLSHLHVAGRDYDEVATGLFVGPTPNEAGALAPHFDAVLDCRESPDDAVTYRRLGINYRRLPFGDDGPPPLANRLDPALAWIENQLADGKRVLIHCRAGLNRGPFVACAYLLPEFKEDLGQTLKHLKRCRSEIRINPVLLASLRRESDVGEGKIGPTIPARRRT